MVRYHKIIGEGGGGSLFNDIALASGFGCRSPRLDTLIVICKYSNTVYMSAISTKRSQLVGILKLLQFYKE